MLGRSKTWWGAEFIAALERWMDPGRLQRGRSYASDYRLTQFAIKGGDMSATVRGNISPYFGVTSTPYYKVSIKLRKIPAAQWSRILGTLGSNADWVTHLVLGEVPPTIGRALQGSPVGLLPKSRGEVTSSCSCPDYANPCKHVAGVYFRVAALLDRDPLLLFELRGMERTKLQAAVSKSEFGGALLSEGRASKPDLAAALTTAEPSPVGCLPDGDAPTDPRSFWRGGATPRAQPTDRQLPPVSALLLRREGDYPEFWQREISFVETMAEIYERIAIALPKDSPDRSALDIAGPSAGR